MIMHTTTCNFTHMKQERNPKQKRSGRYAVEPFSLWYPLLNTESLKLIVRMAIE